MLVVEVGVQTGGYCGYHGFRDRIWYLTLVGCSRRMKGVLTIAPDTVFTSLTLKSQHSRRSPSHTICLKGQHSAKTITTTSSDPGMLKLPGSPHV